MTHEYAPASDVTLAFFRKDVERGDEQLESIMISRVVMGEILARIAAAESDRDLAHDDWQAAQDQVARLTVALGVVLVPGPESAQIMIDVLRSRLAAVERERDQARSQLAALTEQYMTFVEGADL